MASRTRRAAAGIVSGDGEPIGPSGTTYSSGGLDGGGASAAPLGGPIIIDPSAIGGGSDGSVNDGPGTVTGNSGPADGSRRTRGPNKPRAKASLNLAALERILIGAHRGIAKLTGDKEWELEKTEASELSAATLAVTSHYPALEVPPELADAFALASVAFAIYAPRVMANQMRKRREARMTQVNRPGDTAAPQAQPAVIVTTGPASPVPQASTPARPKGPNIVDLSSMGLGTVAIDPMRRP